MEQDGLAEGRLSESLPQSRLRDSLAGGSLHISELLLSTIASHLRGLRLKELSRKKFIRCYLNLDIVKLTYFTAP